MEKSYHQKEGKFRKFDVENRKNVIVTKLTK